MKLDFPQTNLGPLLGRRGLAYDPLSTNDLLPGQTSTLKSGRLLFVSFLLKSNPLTLNL